MVGEGRATVGGGVGSIDGIGSVGDWGLVGGGVVRGAQFSDGAGQCIGDGESHDGVASDVGGLATDFEVAALEGPAFVFGAGHVADGGAEKLGLTRVADDPFGEDGLLCLVEGELFVLVAQLRHSVHAELVPFFTFRQGVKPHFGDFVEAVVEAGETACHGAGGVRVAAEIDGAKHRGAEVIRR